MTGTSAPPPYPEAVRPVGIKDVARAAGLSATTVSHALSGKGKVSADTRARVRGIADALGYRPAEPSRVRRGGRTGVLGLVVGPGGGDPAGPVGRGYGGALAAGAVAEAVDRGHALVVMPGGPGDDRWTGVPVDGLIVVAPVMGDPAVTEARRRGLAVVTDGRPPAPEHSRVPYAHSDMEQGVRLVMEHLAERGARRVGLLTGPSSDAYTRDSEHAYVRWCAGRAWPATVERAGGGEPPLDAARRLLASERRPDAVHALHESYGEAVLTAAAERGLAVPGDLLVTAMGDGAPHPELTLLSRSPRATGALCVTLLIDVLHGGRPEPRPVPCALLPGASTAVGGERGHARPVPAPRTA